MKKLMLCGALLALMTPAVVSAQNSTTAKPAAQATVSTNDEIATRQRELTSFISMIEAGVSRNSPDVAQDGLQKAMALMQETISRQSRAAAGSSAGMDAATKKKIDRENKIYSDVKMASVDPTANVTKISTLLKEFRGMM